MKPPPQTQKELLKEATSLGLLRTNPVLDDKRKELISYVYNSNKIGRGLSQASILFVGSSGVGKSSTINHLFQPSTNINFAKTSSTASETRTTTEFIIKADDPNFKVKDLKLGLVDTPGFNDTDGMRQDACNFFSIKQFYKKHPTLGGSRPNLIFVMINADDKRIDGDNSNLAKSLKCLMKLNLVDSKHPNVIGVMTHACHLGGKPKNWTKKFEEKKGIFKKIMFKHLNVAADVVALENTFGPDDHDLQVSPSGDYTYLPDEVTLQPKNLYNACINVFKANGDQYGQLIFNRVFSEERNVPTKGFEFDAKSAKKDRLSQEEEQFLDFFQKTAMGDGAEDPLFKAADDFIVGNNLSNDEIDNVQALTSSLKQNGITDMDDLKLVSQDAVKFMTGMDLGPVDNKYLDYLKVKKVKPVNLDDSMRLVGQGFNLKHDQAMPAIIFNYDTRNTNCGLIVPAPAQFTKFVNTCTFMETFESQESLTKSRMQHLSVSLDVDYGTFGASARAGFSSTGSASSSSTSKEYSFLFEQRMFELSMGNYEELFFTEDFKSDVQKLPKEFEVTDQDNRKSFEKFFNRWGHFVITKAYGGGCVEARINTNHWSSSGSGTMDMKAELTSAFSGGPFSVSGSVEGGQSSSHSSNAQRMLSQSTLIWKGGSGEFHTDTLANTEQMTKWKLSLTQKPTMLSTDMSLDPISVLVERVQGDKGAACYKALEDCLGGKFHLQTLHEKKEEHLNKEKEAAEKKQRDDAEASRKKDVENNQPKQSEQCFPGDAMVTTEAGQVTMKDLTIGQKILTLKKGKTLLTPFLGWIHRVSGKVAHFLALETESQKISLSPKHVIFRKKHGQTGSGSTAFADEVEVGDHLQVLSSGEVRWEAVLSIQAETKTGVYAPLTSTGTLLVDNVLASCYANYLHQSVANIAFLPMKLFKRLQDNGDSEREDGLRSFPRFLNQLGKQLNAVKES